MISIFWGVWVMLAPSHAANWAILDLWERYVAHPVPSMAAQVSKELRESDASLSAEEQKDFESSIASHFEVLAKGIRSRQPESMSLAFRLRRYLQEPLRREIDGELASLIREFPDDYLRAVKAHSPIDFLEGPVLEVSQRELRLLGSRATIWRMRLESLRKTSSPQFERVRNDCMNVIAKKRI